MADVNYILKAIQRKGTSYLQRQSVLWPLLNKRSKTEEEVIHATMQVLTWWREKAAALKKAGWLDLNTSGKLQYVRNCPPSTAVALSEKQFRCCKLSAICPWCYARAIADLYTKFAELLPARNATKKKALRIFEMMNSRVMTLKQAGSYLDAHLRTWKLAPITFLNRIKPLGAYYNVTLEPFKHRHGKTVWKFTYHVVAIVDDSWSTPEKIPRTAKCKLSIVRSRKQLIPILRRACRYPVGLMTGDEKYVMMALNARKGLRCNALLGCLREKGHNTDVSQYIVEQETSAGIGQTCG